MTDFELAFRLAEIRKAKKHAAGRNSYSQRISMRLPIGQCVLGIKMT